MLRPWILCHFFMTEPIVETVNGRTEWGTGEHVRIPVSNLLYENRNDKLRSISARVRLSTSVQIATRSATVFALGASAFHQMVKRHRQFPRFASEDQASGTRWWVPLGVIQDHQPTTFIELYLRRDISQSYGAVYWFVIASLGKLFRRSPRRIPSSKMLTWWTA
jgi:hypothetical protein